MSGENILTAQGLGKRFGAFAAVTGVDLSVKRGEVHALIGPNGAGKTTLFNLLTKTFQPSGGRIIFNGHDITGLNSSQVARLGLIRSYQISSVFSAMSVLENIRLGLQLRRHGPSYAFWQSGRVLRRLDDEAAALAQELGLGQYLSQTAGVLSYGRKRALELATALAADPLMLLLDEPMAGLGVEEIDRIGALIQRVSATRTILMVEHNLKVVAQLSDRITVLSHGQVLTSGTYAEVARHPDVIEAYIGGEAA